MESTKTQADSATHLPQGIDGAEAIQRFLNKQFSLAIENFRFASERRANCHPVEGICKTSNP